MENLNKYLNKELEQGNVKLIRESNQRNYYVSKQGEVYSMTKVNKIVKKLKPKVTGDKYLQVTTVNGRQEYVHRLVAEAFLNDYSKELQVNHIDSNRHNNSLENLEMCTLQENIDHRTISSRMVDWRTSVSEIRAFQEIKQTNDIDIIIQALDFHKTMTVVLATTPSMDKLG